MVLNLSNSIKHSILIRKCFRIGQTKSTFYRHDILLSKSWLFFITQLKSVVLVIYLVLHNSTRNMSTWIIDLVFQFVTLYLETFDIMNNWTLLHYIRKLFSFFQFMWLENLVDFCSNWEISVKLEFANFFLCNMIRSSLQVEYDDFLM